MTTISDFSHRIEPLITEVSRTNPERGIGLRSAADAVAQSRTRETALAALEGFKKSISHQFCSSEPRLAKDLTRAADDEISRIQRADQKRTLEEKGTGEPPSKVQKAVEKVAAADEIARIQGTNQKRTLEEEGTGEPPSKVQKAVEKAAAAETVSGKPEGHPVSPMAILYDYVLRAITETSSDSDRRNVALALSQHPQTEALRKTSLPVDFDYCRLLASDPELQELLQKTFGLSGRLPAVPEREILQTMENESLARFFSPFKECAERLQFEWSRLPDQVRHKFVVDGQPQFQSLIGNPALCKEILRAIRSFNLVSLAHKARVELNGDSRHEHEVRNLVFGAEDTKNCFSYEKGELISKAEKVARYLQSNQENITRIAIHESYRRPDAMTLVPFEVIECLKLKDLELRYQRLTSLPSQIAQLSKLRHLVIDANELFSIPDTIRLLQSLETLEVQMNPLVVLPDTIEELQELEYLEIDDNDPPVSIPDRLWQRVREGKLRIMGYSQRGYRPLPPPSPSPFQQLQGTPQGMSFGSDYRVQQPIRQEEECLEIEEGIRRIKLKP